MRQSVFRGKDSQLAIFEAGQSTSSVNPERPLPILSNTQYNIMRQAVLCAVVSESPILQPSDPTTGCADPERPLTILIKVVDDIVFYFDCVSPDSNRIRG